MADGKSASRWERARAVAHAETERFDELFRLAGLDPKRHARFADWSGCSFEGSQLSKFDLTGSRLDGCDFTRAQLTSGFSAGFSDTFAKWHVRLDQAELARIIHTPGRDPHLPAVMTLLAEPSKANDWEAFKSVWGKPQSIPSDDHLPVGAIFQDAPFGPEMVVVPAGAYLQGDETKPVDGISRREVTITQPLAVGRFEVTFDEWDWAQAHPEWEKLSGIPPRRPDDEKWGRGRRPVIDVSWLDAQAYARWLSTLTGQTYRLLTEAEWESACRAGTPTAYSSGDTITREQAQFSDGEVGSAEQTVEVGTFPCNAWGLQDMHGNVWEWCEDKWHDSYDGAPSDGRARSSDDPDVFRVLRGGSWFNNPQDLRSAYRVRNRPGLRSRFIGFRLARTLNPTP